MKISHKQFDAERALYNLCDGEVCDCTFQGEADGESALKETRNIVVRRCGFYLRYPLWHCNGFELADCTLFEGCRAPLWYDNHGQITNCTILGVKPLRECDNISLENCKVDSAEVGWNCRDIKFSHCDVTSEYFLLGAQRVSLFDVTLHGKYSFQYVCDMTVENSRLVTKDAFWHTKNVTVKNSRVEGEYLGWYSDGLTLINCEISGTQPLCYCTNLTLINCTMTGCDLSFEYSDVNADIKGTVLSVKNPRSGSIVADGFGDIVWEDSVVESHCSVSLRKK